MTIDRACIHLALAAILLLPPAALHAGDQAPRFFAVVDKDSASALFESALEKWKSGDREAALAGFESALVSDQSLLLKNDGGMASALIVSYEKKAAQICDVAVYYKLAHLYDLTGDIEKAAENYRMARKTSLEREILDEVSKKLEGLEKEIEFYKKQDPPPLESEYAGAPSSNGETSRKPAQFDPEAENRRRTAEKKKQISDVDEKLAAKEKELASAKNTERMAKNDWSGRTDFQRDWRDIPNDNAPDPQDPYQNAYRRRFRQARNAREAIDRDIEALKKERERLETELRYLDPAPIE